MLRSKITWTDNTFNPWIGCTQVSEGCKNCYAKEQQDKRFGNVKWGKGQPRKRTSEANWRQPRIWNAEAEKAGKRIRVFCASLADVFDGEVQDGWRDDLFALIRATPHLDWLIVTKRPEIAVAYAKNIVWPANAWIGTSVENQDVAERAQIITEIQAPVRFLSVEPLLGLVKLDLKGIDWVIVGGESGNGFRPMNAAWATAIRDQCAEEGVTFFFKQWSGRHPHELGHELDGVVHHAFPIPKMERLRPGGNGTE